MPTLTTYTRTLQAIEIAKGFRTQHACPTADNLEAFQEALIRARRVALEPDTIGWTAAQVALCTSLASRVESTSPATAMMVVDLLGENGHDQVVRDDFLARFTAANAETARCFMEALGCDPAILCPRDYFTVARYFLHCLNLRVQA